MPLVWKQFGSAHAASAQLKACTKRPTGGIPGRKGVDRRCCERGWEESVSGLPRAGFLPAAAEAASAGAAAAGAVAGFICDAAAAPDTAHLYSDSVSSLSGPVLCAVFGPNLFFFFLL